MNDSSAKEVLSHLRQDPARPGHFLLNEPHLLYLVEQQANAYLDAMNSEDYRTSFHGPTVEIIESNLATLFPGSDGVSLIDLGPGYPDKSLPIAKHLSNDQTPCKYVPVDISRRFLDIAAREMKPFVEQVYPIHRRFEECASQIPAEVYDYSAYCMIGLTFMNFPPQFLMPILKDIAREQGRVLVASELLTSQKTPEVILDSYRTKGAESVGFGPLKILGHERTQFDYEPVFSKGRVELHYRLRGQPCAGMRSLGVETGNTIVTAISFRYTVESLENVLRGYFRKVLTMLSQDTGTAVVLAMD